MKKLSIWSVIIIPGLILSACSTNLETPLSTANEDSTYLKQNVDNFTEIANKSCSKSKYELFGNEYANKFNLEILNTQKMQDELKRIVNDSEDLNTLTQQIKDFVNQNKNSNDTDLGDWDSICKKNENIYVLFQAKGPAELISLWKDKKTFEFFNDEKNEIAYFGSDSSVSFFPESLDDKSLVYVSIKDFPENSWIFYSLDKSTMNASIIEECTLNDKSELICTKQYKLVN